jgi:hypothetical protein
VTDALWNPRPNRLAGRRVAICAVTPSDSAPPAEVVEAHRSSSVLEAEETVVSFLRAMLAEGATVTLIADEPLALLAGVVAGEYADANVKIIVVGEQRTEAEADVLAPLQLFIRRVDTFRSAVDSIADARAVLLAGEFDRDDIAAVRERTPAASLFAIAASGVDRWAADGHIRFLDDIARREFSLASGEASEEGAEYEYPPVAFAAQWLVQFLIEDPGTALVRTVEPSPSASAGSRFVNDERRRREVMVMVNWADMVVRLLGVAKYCLESGRKRWRRFAPAPGDFVRRAIEDLKSGVIHVQGTDSVFQTLAKRISHLVQSGLE